MCIIFISFWQFVLVCYACCFLVRDLLSIYFVDGRLKPLYVHFLFSASCYLPLSFCDSGSLAQFIDISFFIWLFKGILYSVPTVIQCFAKAFGLFSRL